MFIAMAGDTTEEAIKIGGVEYVVDVGKIPYFASFLRFQRLSGQCAGSAVPEHEDLPLFAAINQAVKHGHRHFFRNMPDSLDDYKVLCETLERLTINILGGYGLNEIIAAIKSAKSDWDPEERREIYGNKLEARDAAFKLLYIFILGEFNDDVRDSNKAYEAILYVVSHRATFKCRTRGMVRRAYEDRFKVSDNQRKALDKWTIFEPEGKDEWKKKEETTEESYDMSYDSDIY